MSLPSVVHRRGCFTCSLSSCPGVLTRCCMWVVALHRYRGLLAAIAGAPSFVWVAPRSLAFLVLWTRPAVAFPIHLLRVMPCGIVVVRAVHPVPWTLHCRQFPPHFPTAHMLLYVLSPYYLIVFWNRHGSFGDSEFTPPRAVVPCL